MKRLVASLLCVAALCGFLTASADYTAGTGADPLISRSFADTEIFSDTAEKAGAGIDAVLNERVDGRLAEAGITGEGGVITALSPRRIVLYAGGTIELLTGAEFSVSAGTASVVTEGTVIDLGAGEEYSALAKLEYNTKYFAAENTRAALSADTDTIITISGRYRVKSGETLDHVYSDVANPAAWYFGYVCYAYENRLFYGWEGDRFYPDEKTSRADMVYALWVAAGSPEYSAEDVFTDVAADTWYSSAVGWAAANGIVNGYGDGTFLPENSISRQEIAAVMQRYARFLGRDTSQEGDLSEFTDEAEIADWAYGYLSWAVGSGLMNGMGNGKMEPRGTTTRAQIATLLQRVFTE